MDSDSEKDLDYRAVRISCLSRTSLEAFRFRAESLLSAGVDERKFLRHVALHLPDEILARSGGKIRDIRSIAQLVIHLEECLSGALLPIDHILAFDTAKQEPQETLEQTFERLLRLGEKAYPNFDGRYLEEMSFGKLVKNAISPEVAKELMMAQEQSFDLRHAIRRADRNVQITQSARAMFLSNSSPGNLIRNQTPPSNTVPQNLFSGGPVPRMGYPKAEIPWTDRKPGQGMFTPRAQAQPFWQPRPSYPNPGYGRAAETGRPEFKGECFNCGVEGHTARRCTSPRISCSNCHRNHLPKFCPLNPQTAVTPQGRSAPLVPNLQNTVSFATTVESPSNDVGQIPSLMGPRSLPGGFMNSSEAGLGKASELSQGPTVACPNCQGKHLQNFCPLNSMGAPTSTSFPSTRLAGAQNP